MGGPGALNGKTGIFLQVRLSSTRLPRKALLPIEGKAIITHAMESLRLMSADSYVLVTDKESSREVEPYASDAGFLVFQGPRDDVLRRFVLAAEFFGVDTIIRATGDNPLVDSTLAAMLIEAHRSISADYSGFDGPPIGSGVEILKTSALIQADAITSDGYDREHVSPYLYLHPEKFRINRTPAPAEFCLPDSLVTIDTANDYEYIRRLYADLYRGSPLGVMEIIPWLVQNRRPV
ncbi:MAG: acylneuraminate cytidylyltransferase [Spirochaetales bacterium]|nr:acylneuraminate cytidylyltransferase [Spirochaetales bacterium]